MRCTHHLGTDIFFIMLHWLQSPDFVLLYACSGQRVIIQENIEGQMVENVVTIQVEIHPNHLHKYTYK